MVWSYRSNSKDQLELVSAIEVELGAVETLLCQETAYYMLDSGEVQRCRRDQGYRSEDTEKFRNILPIIVDMLFFFQAEYELWSTSLFCKYEVSIHSQATYNLLSICFKDR